MSGPTTKLDVDRSPSNGHAELLYVVGIGASAGGLEALERLFKKLPADTGMAFVIVQHLSPDFDSVMDELLVRQTKMPIRTVEDGIDIKPNAIYLIPPRKEMIISGGRLLLTDKDPKQGLTLPIDTFFRSLAQDCGTRSVGVILSGTGSDGSRGIRDIHAAGGMVLVQTEECSGNRRRRSRTLAGTHCRDFGEVREESHHQPACRPHGDPADQRRRYEPRHATIEERVRNRLFSLQADHRDAAHRKATAAKPVVGL